MHPHIRRALTASAGALAVAALVTACGSSSSSSTPAPASAAPSPADSPDAASPSAASTLARSVPGANPCEILTNDEIAAITGNDPGTAALDAQPTSCTYSGGLAVSVISADPAVNAEALMNNAGASGVLPLDAVGDNAAYAEFKDQGVVLVIAQQDGLQIGIYDTASVETASKLAQAMLDKVTG